MKLSVLFGACILAFFVVDSLASGCPYHDQHNVESYGTVGGYHAKYVV